MHLASCLRGDLYLPTLLPISCRSLLAAESDPGPERPRGQEQHPSPWPLSAGACSHLACEMPHSGAGGFSKYTLPLSKPICILAREDGKRPELHTTLQQKCSVNALFCPESGICAGQLVVHAGLIHIWAGSFATIGLVILLSQGQRNKRRPASANHSRPMWRVLDLDSVTLDYNLSPFFPVSTLPPPAGTFPRSSRRFGAASNIALRGLDTFHSGAACLSFGSIAPTITPFCEDSPAHQLPRASSLSLQVFLSLIYLQGAHPVRNALIIPSFFSLLRFHICPLAYFLSLDSPIPGSLHPISYHTIEEQTKK